MTHAWLIIAHNEWGILQRLVSELDAPECDFYVHIDKKVKDLPLLKVEKGRLIMLENRVDVRWGSVSQIECELTLFEAAAANGPYDFYHIISGVTLPLKLYWNDVGSWDAIYEVLEKDGDGNALRAEYPTVIRIRDGKSDAVRPGLSAVSASLTVGEDGALRALVTNTSRYAEMTDIILTVTDAGGDVLYPGDEKEMLMRGVQSIIMQAFAGIDNALKAAPGVLEGMIK